MGRLLIFILPLLGYSSCHVSLVFPPARDLNLDFLDNIRTPAPCGMPKGEAKMSFLAGSAFNVTWHLGYPHRGGFKIELLDKNEKPITSLTPVEESKKKDGFISEDPTQQSFSVQLPSAQCVGCSIRLIRKAAEWGPRYRFWSCADVDILVNKQEVADVCGEFGKVNAESGACDCENYRYGDRCHLEDECLGDQDCGGRGKCIQEESTTVPRSPKKCYCNLGYFGKYCEQESSVREKLSSFSSYKSVELSKSMTLYWKILENSNEIEMVAKSTSKTWIAIGWRPNGMDKTCKQFWGMDKSRIPKTVPRFKRQAAVDNNMKFAPKGEFHDMDCTDIVIGVAKGDLGRVVDSYTRDRSTPLPDELYGGASDIQAALAYEDEEDTIMMFRKPLISNHPSDHSIEEGLMHIIWAVGQKQGMYSHAPRSGIENGNPSIPDFYKEDEIKYHGKKNRGDRQLNLMEKKAEDKCSFRYPEGCVEDCQYTAQWRRKADGVSFEVTSSDLEKWTGIGFSENSFMPSTRVVLGGEVDSVSKVSEGWISGYSPPTLKGLQTVEGSSFLKRDGKLTLKFQKKLQGLSEKDVDLRSKEGIYLIFPVGGGRISSLDAKEIKIGKHSVTPIVSQERVVMSNCREENVIEKSFNDEIEVVAAAEPESEPDANADAEPESEPEATAEAEPESEPEVNAEAEPESEPEANAEAEPESEPEATAEAEAESEPETKKETNTEAQPENEPEANVEAEPASEPEANAAAEPEDEPEANAEAEPESEPESVAEAEPESESEANFEAEPESEPEANAEAEPESEPEANAEAEPEIEPESNIDSEPESEPEANAETEPESESETNAAAEAESEPEANAEAEQESEPEANSEEEPESEPEANAEAEPESEPETNVELEAEKEPEANAETEPKSESEANSEAEPESEPEANAEAEPESEPEANVDSEPEREPEANAESEPESEPVANAEAEPESEPEANAEAELDIELKANAESELDGESEADAAVEPESEPVAKLEIDIDVDIESEPEAESEPSSEVVAEAGAESEPESKPEKELLAKHTDKKSESEPEPESEPKSEPQNNQKDEEELSIGVDADTNESQTETESEQGEYIAQFQNIFHGITGRAYALGQSTILIKQFTYDGQGPDAFFYGGFSGVPGEDGDVVLPFPSDGKEYGYDDQDIPILGSFDGSKDILLKLPGDTTVNDLRWVSVWCRAFSVNFGQLIFPEEFQYTEVKPEPEPETESEPESEPEAEPEAESEPEPESQQVLEPKIDIDISDMESSPRTRGPKSSFFSCYRTSSSPVLPDDMSDMNAVLDTCEESDLMEMVENGAKIMKSGKYQLSFTSLMKSTGFLPITVEIKRIRSSEEKKMIGTNTVNLSSNQGQPEVGLSSSIFMIEELQKDDILEITQSYSNGSSFLRSSDWNLLRLEGHLAGQTGISCMITIDQDKEMFCDNNDGIEIDINKHGLKIHKSGTYEIALSGLTYQVPGEIGKINILRTADGKSEIISTAFSHVKDAWQDDGVKFDKITLPVNALTIENLSRGDFIWVETDSSTSNSPLKSKLKLTLEKIEGDGMVASCDISTPVLTKLVKLNTCNIDTDGAVDVKTGVFIAPQDGVYKTSFNGVMKVQGQSKVHANILKRDMKGKLKTQVAGFAKLTSGGLETAMFGAELSVSEVITSYSRLTAGEELCLGMGRDKEENSIGGVRSGGREALHFTVQFIST